MVVSCRVLSLSQLDLPGPDLQLVAFLVLHAVESTLVESKVGISKSLLFAKMKEMLPNYCVPDQIEILKQLPVNEHGKV